MAELNVRAATLKQHGTTLYQFHMNSEQLAKICYVTVRSENDPKEIQRLLIPKRAKEIGAYIKQDDSLLPTAMVVNLTNEVSVSPSGNAGEVVLKFPDGDPEDKKYAYVLDGQHRLEGFKHSDGVHFDLPVVAVYNASDATRAKIFVDINSKQVKVSKVHVHALGYDFGMMGVDDQAVAAVVDKLNEDADSPLKDLIKVMDGQKNTWVDNFKVAIWLKPHIASGGVLHGKTTAQQTHIIKEYFRGIEKAWPHAWANDKFRLSGPLGIEVMLRVFPSVKARCDLFKGFQYTADNFAEELEPLKNLIVKLSEDFDVDLTWEVGTAKYFGSQALRGILVNQMRDALNPPTP